MKAHFTNKWELIIVPETVVEGLALSAWAVKYFNEGEQKVYLLIQTEVEGDTVAHDSFDEVKPGDTPPEGVIRERMRK